MREKFVIQGGKPLEGEIEVRGAKNAAFPVLAATLLTEKPCLIKNLPLIEDVFRMIELLESLGAEISWQGERELKIQSSQISLERVKADIVSALRGSILLYGSLLSRLGKVALPQPGGCIIGARPLDAHLDVFEQLGVQIKKEGNSLDLKRGKTKKEREILLSEFSVTATSNALLAAACLAGETVLKTADQDYQVQELLKVLAKMGVKVKEFGSHKIVIEGKEELEGFEHTLISDPIEAGTFVVLAAATKGNVLIKKVPFEFLELFFRKMEKAGLPMEIDKERGEVRVLPWENLSEARKSGEKGATGLRLGKVQALPYPGLHTDLLSAIAVLATQADGSTLIHDPLYEGRFKYLEELNRMGAKIFFADPHRVVVQGPTPLYGKKLGSIDLRGGAALIIAGLIAEGKSTIDNIYQIDRGYEKIEKRLQKIGADIRRIKGE